MILAELHVWHSRPVAPTRRVALGHAELPVERPPGFGGLLLAGIVAAHHGDLDEDDLVDLHRLMGQVERGERIAQPRLRHRLQVDRIGLMRAEHRLLGLGERLELRFEEGAPPAPQVLAAVYSVGSLPYSARVSVMTVVRSALRWRGGTNDDLVDFLTGRGPSGGYVPRDHIDPVDWALGVLGLQADAGRTAIQRRYRMLLREAHPDHGGNRRDAPLLIRDLGEARRILLSEGIGA
jgi:hypothetical protein